MSVWDWAPTVIPPELRQYASDCPDCRELRRQLAALLRPLVSGGRSRVSLQVCGHGITVNDLSVHCSACGNMGVLLRGDLVQLLRQARELMGEAEPQAVGKAPPQKEEPTW